jgi:hypothetical protein
LCARLYVNLNKRWRTKMKADAFRRTGPCLG